MADGFKNSIRLGVELAPTNNIESQINGIIENLNNKKIELDLTLKDNKIFDTLERLNNILNNTKQNTGGNIDLGNINNTINTTIEQLGKLDGEIQKVSRINLGNGLYKQTEYIATGIGEITKQVGVVQKIGDNFEYVGSVVRTTTSDLVGYDNALMKIQQAQSSLSKLNLVDREKVSGLSNTLNTTNLGSTNQLNQTLEQVKQLEAEEKSLQQTQNKMYSESSKLQQEEYSIKQKLITAEGEYKAKLEESLVSNRLLQDTQNQKIANSGLQTEEKDLELTNQRISLQEKLNQLKAKNSDKINTETQAQLEREQELLQKQAEAYQKINTLKANGVINSSEISKLEELARSASTIKEMNSALSSIGQSTSRESSISNLTKQITDAENKLQQMKQKFSEKLPNGFVESMEASLNKLKEDLKTVDGTNFTGIKNGLNSVKSSMEQTNNETKQLMNSLKETNSGGFFSGISNFLAKTGLFYGTIQVVQEITSQLKEASQYTINMDKSFTNMQMITGKSKSEISGMVDSYKSLAEQLHTTYTEMMGGMEEVTRAGFNQNQGQDLLSSAIIGSKISGQSTQEVTQQLIAIKNAFKDFGDGTTSMEHAVDVISKLDNTSATSFAEIATAIQRTAYSAQEAGTPFDKLATYIATVSEKTRKSAETINDKLVA
jgi:uncharacterized protein (UPF0335 family)